MKKNQISSGRVSLGFSETAVRASNGNKKGENSEEKRKKGVLGGKAGGNCLHESMRALVRICTGAEKKPRKMEEGLE